jgi:hypothetical protein
MEKERQSEQIIGFQSLILIAVALSGWLATDSIIASFEAIRDPSSFAAIATDKGLSTDRVEIDLTYTEAIVNNFRFICLTAIAIASIIGFANLIRLLKKDNNA